jgi:hypothetical protein
VEGDHGQLRGQRFLTTFSEKEFRISIGGGGAGQWKKTVEFLADELEKCKDNDSKEASACQRCWESLGGEEGVVDSFSSLTHIADRSWHQVTFCESELRSCFDAFNFMAEYQSSYRETTQRSAVSVSEEALCIPTKSQPNTIVITSQTSDTDTANVMKGLKKCKTSVTLNTDFRAKCKKSVEVFRWSP